MLRCTRKPGESIAIPDLEITFTVLSVGAVSVRIYIAAPRKFSIDREGLTQGPQVIENDPRIGHVVLRRKARESVSVCQDFVLLIEKIRWSEPCRTYVAEVRVDAPENTQIILLDAIAQEPQSENDPLRSPYSHLPKWARPPQ